MRNQILNYIPEASTNYLIEILNKENIQILVKKERKTKHGDFRVLKNGKCQITINSNLNPYRFLITLIHEIAHYRVYKIFEKKVKPHGKEWKDILRGLSYTEEGVSYFKFKDFWKYIIRTKIWDTKKYPKQKTARMLETLFDAEEIPGKINNKSVRYMSLPTLKLDKPNTRKDKMKEAPFA